MLSIKRLFGYMKSEVRNYSIAFVLIMLNSIFTVISSISMMRIVDIITVKSYNELFKWCSIFFIVSISMLGSTAFLKILYQRIGNSVAQNVRIDCLSKLHKLSGKECTNINTAEMLNLLETDMRYVAIISSSMYLQFINEVMISMLLLGWIAVLQVDLLVIFILIQILTFIFQTICEKFVILATEEYRQIIAARGSVLYESVSNILHHILSKATNYFFFKYKQKETDYIKADVKMVASYSLNSFLLAFVGTLSVVVILGYGGYKVIIGSLTLGGLISFNTYTQKLMAPIVHLAELKTQRAGASVSLSRIWRFIDLDVSVKNPSVKQSPDSISGDILLSDISFSYGDNVVLKHITMRIKPKTCNAIVGKSGSGKTTILYLLYRLWDPISGEIQLDGVNIKNYDIDFLRNQMSIISQNTYLFNDTIYENITIGRSVEMAEVRHVCKAAQIDSWIESLSDNYNTVIGESGIKLSGGQRQRLSIARALLQNAPIIIMDEATSALDVKTESDVLLNLKDLFHGKTLLIITHRLSTISSADTIHVIDDGQIVESGSHDELVSLKGVYGKLYKYIEMGDAC